MARKSVAIITSALNEQECVPEFLARLNEVALTEPTYSFHVIIIDNGSVDETWLEITKFKRKKSSLKILALRMARTFSFDSALTCGLDNCESDFAVLMTSDLQDPPECIPQLLRLSESGFHQVLVRVRSRKSVPIIRRLLTTIFYQIAGRMTTGIILNSVSDFRLVSRDVYRAMRQLRERHRFMRGIGSWVGFSTTTLEIDRPPRFGGESKWVGTKIAKVISKSILSIFAFTVSPLNFIAAFGTLMSFLSILAISILAVIWIFFGVPFAGFGSIMGIIILGFSILLMCLGLVAQYVALIYEEVKNRPLYIIAEVSK